MNNLCNHRIYPNGQFRDRRTPYHTAIYFKRKYRQHFSALLHNDKLNFLIDFPHGTAESILASISISPHTIGFETILSLRIEKIGKSSILIQSKQTAQFLVLNTYHRLELPLLREEKPTRENLLGCKVSIEIPPRKFTGKIDGQCLYRSNTIIEKYLYCSKFFGTSRRQCRRSGIKITGNQQKKRNHRKFRQGKVSCQLPKTSLRVKQKPYKREKH